MGNWELHLHLLFWLQTIYPWANELNRRFFLNRFFFSLCDSCTDVKSGVDELDPEVVREIPNSSELREQHSPATSLSYYHPARPALPASSAEPRGELHYNFGAEVRNFSFAFFSNSTHPFLNL